ncbi:MAG: hypothetical protein V8K32_00245 [Candidatus Electrothrix gigas]
MKKDFLPIKKEVAQQTEDEFVEEHWSEKWHHQEVDYKEPVAVIGGSDQFRLLNKYLDILSDLVKKRPISVYR